MKLLLTQQEVEQAIAAYVAGRLAIDDHTITLPKGSMSVHGADLDDKAVELREFTLSVPFVIRKKEAAA